MRNRIPEDAFAYYVGLGTMRSYELVAEHFGVTKRAITKAAAREDWTRRLEALELRAREATDARLAKQIEETHVRHKKMLMAMAARAVKALQEFPLTSGMDGIRAAAMVIKLERVLDAEKPEHDVVDVAAIVKREQETWLVSGGNPSDDWDDADAEDDDEDDAGEPVSAAAQEGDARGDAGSDDAESA